MLTGNTPEREPAVTPSQESEGVTAACSVQLCYRAIALSDWDGRGSSISVPPGPVPQARSAGKQRPPDSVVDGLRGSLLSRGACLRHRTGRH